MKRQMETVQADVAAAHLHSLLLNSFELCLGGFSHQHNAKREMSPERPRGH